MNSVSADLFKYINEPNLQRELFKQFVETVEMEIFSYCNRVCTFCPNSKIDRRSVKNYMNLKTYSNIISQLASIDYSGDVWYSRYNEPTSDRETFLARIEEARSALPKARLCSYTNGDYLSLEYLSHLRWAGLDLLKIMIYLPPGEPETMENFCQRMTTRLQQIGLDWSFGGKGAHGAVKASPPTEFYGTVVINPEPLYGLEVTCEYKKFTTPGIGTNRGGLLETGGVLDRQEPCIIPATGMFVDWNGSVVPCCDIRSDAPEHKDCVVARLTPESSLFAVYANSPLVDWRRSMFKFGSKKEPCNTCIRVQVPDTPEVRETFSKIESLIN